MGIREVLSTPRSPWQRAYIERVIGSIRRECLDHLIVFHESSLRRALASYLDYYHRSQTHLSPGKESPVLYRFCQDRVFGRDNHRTPSDPVRGAGDSRNVRSSDRSARAMRNPIMMSPEVGRVPLAGG